MTISEQLREAALCDEDPYSDMPAGPWMECRGWVPKDHLLMDLRGDNLRTFMLLVAEALE